MKRINLKNLLMMASLAMLFFLPGCNDILEEEPHDFYEPGFFSTEAGVLQGLTSHYANLRTIYGYPYYFNACETGTDEYTYGQSADGNFKDADLSGVGQLTPSTSRSDVLWNNTFSDINTASGIIQNAEAVGVSNALIAESRFFRAFDYFALVQTFGGVPLDLGSGELTFNITPSRTSTRNTVPEVYTKAVFPDLLIAINDLPESPRLTGTATKNLARLILAKAYLTYGWWLENPNNIPTYPDTPRTDPDGHDAQWYFQQAYDVAMTAINNPGPYSLQPTFYDVHWGGNDRNSEMMLYSDHTENSDYYNGDPVSGWGTTTAVGNTAGWMATWNYTAIRSSSSSGTWSPVSTVQRQSVQPLGRPWVRMAPTIGAITNTFTDKAIDSRYDGTFTTTYRGNWDDAGDTNTTYYNANFMPIQPGDKVLSFLDANDPSIVYPTGGGQNEVGAGVLPGRADFVVGPNGISRRVYPGLWKVGPYRTDNNGTLGQPNVPTTRPYPIAKFSELYFVAAEALVKGATGGNARDLINVIRARAGKWSWFNKENMERIEDNSAAMTAATPATITIDYILAERSREYFGEGYRWLDLVRTQKWAEIAGSYQICGADLGDHVIQTITRDIQPYMYLRPIPQGQIDAMEGETDSYQNPGYQ